MLITVNAALAYSTIDAGNQALMSVSNDVVWAGAVMVSFPAAMLIMAGSFGLWKARVISNALFGAGVAAVLLVLAGGTTWASDGMWAPDGVYSRVVSPIIALVWIAVFSGLLQARSPSTVRVPESSVATPASVL